MRRTAQLVRGLAALAAALGVVAAVPAALVRYVGWPLPTSWPDLDSLARVAQVGVTDTAVINTLAVLVWIAWLQVAVAMLVEAAALARRRAARPLPVLPGLQPLAARLVATIMLVTIAAEPSRAAAGVLDAAIVAPATMTVSFDESEPPPPGPGHLSDAETATTTVTIAGRTSWWQLAERHLGDGLRWREVRDLNLNRYVSDAAVVTADTEWLDEGWSLLIPARAARTSEDSASPLTAVADQRQTAEVSGGDGRGWWQVEAGDNFWAIAQASLTETWGRAPTDAEIVPWWRQLVDSNRDRLAPPHDPDLIHPGQRFELPPVPADPTSDLQHDTAGTGGASEGDSGRPPEIPRNPALAPSEAAGNPPAADGGDTSTTDRQAAGSDGHTVDGRPPASRDAPHRRRPEVDAGERDDAAARAGAGWRSAIEPAGRQDRAEAPSADPSDGTAGEATTSWGVPAGLASGTAATGLIAAGVLALLRRRRRAALQQRAAATRLPTPAPDATAQSVRLDAAAPHDDILDCYGGLLGTLPLEVHPSVVMTTDNGTVTLLFTDLPPGEPPPPWRLQPGNGNEPDRWIAELGAQGPARSFGLPLLVTVGRVGANTVLINLGAIRTLTVTGEAAHVRRTLRVMALEAATSRTAGPIDVCVAGDSRLEHVDQIRHIQDPSAEIAAAMAEQDQQIIPDDRIVRLLICHEPTSPPRLPDGLDPYTAVVTATGSGRPGWRLDVDAHRGRLELPDGTRTELDLPEVDPDLVDDEVTQLASTSPAAPQPLPPASVPAVNGHRRDPAIAVRHLEPAWCEVRLLGPIEVVRGGTTSQGLNGLPLQTLAYLVTHPAGVTGEQLEDAIWAGRASLSGSARVRATLRRLRETLGDGPDGQPLLPPRPRNDAPVNLSQHVGCDLDRAYTHLDAAATLRGDTRHEQQAAALELVRGKPFQNLAVSWATDVEHAATARLQDAALEIAGWHREHDRYEQAEAAIRRGLTLCDPCEPLYVEWARIEAARGRRDQVLRIRQLLDAKYMQDDDEIAGWVATVTPETDLAFRQLMAPTNGVTPK